LDHREEVFLALLEQLFFLFDQLSIKSAQGVSLQMLVVAGLFDQRRCKSGGGVFVIGRRESVSLLEQQVFVLLLKMKGSAQKADGSVKREGSLFPRFDGIAQFALLFAGVLLCRSQQLEELFEIHVKTP